MVRSRTPGSKRRRRRTEAAARQTMKRATASFAARRLLQLLLVVFGIAVTNFFLLHLAPGDAAQVLAGEAGSATPEYLAALRKQFGLDQPLPVQFLVYLRNLVTLNLGFSFR